VSNIKQATRAQAQARTKRAKARSRKAVPTVKREYIGRPFVIRYRVTTEEWKEAPYMAAARGHASLSAYLRALVENDAVLLGIDVDRGRAAP